MDRSKAAKLHVEEMDKLYPSEIKYSVENTKIIQKQYGNSAIIGEEPANIRLDKLTTEKAIYKYDDSKSKICILNFANYMFPGGAFLAGSMAQEEALCHTSTLYNVIREFDNEFYDYNRKTCKSELYDDRLLYSKDIIFTSDSINHKADVITCAAPCASSYMMSNPDGVEDLEIAIKNRIKLILAAAADNGVDTIILGAFGCGVFGNDPLQVAAAFIDIIKDLKYNYIFKKIIFAIPDDKNYNQFNIALGWRPLEGC